MAESAAPILRVDVVTLFPELFELPLRTSVIGRAVERGILDFVMHDLRPHGLGRHRSVDDYPYGGGAGMVLRPEQQDELNQVDDIATTTPLAPNRTLQIAGIRA